MEAAFAVQQQLKRELGLQKVQVVRNKNYKAHGTKSYVYLMNKFGFAATMPGPYQHVTRFAQRGLANQSVAVGGRLRKERVFIKKPKPDGDGETGHVTAEDQQNDSMYLCPVGVGTPPQPLKLDFDTGSSDCWFFGPETDPEAKKNHNVFEPSKSSTFEKSPGQEWKISYGDGSTASGTVGRDVLHIGGLEIKKQSIELAKQLSDAFTQGTGDGLLGLAWPSINTITKDGEPDPQPTPVANMISDDTIPKDAELFTSAFYSERDHGKESFYTFGYIDHDLVSASGKDIHWTKIDNSQGFWMFESGHAYVNGEKVSQEGNNAIADTGTTLALVSDEVCKALYKAIPDSEYDEQEQGWVFPISTKAKDLPHFSVSVGNKEFVIQKEDLAFAKTNDGKRWYGGVQSRGENPFDILGDTFLKSVYAIWDQGNTRFGVVPKLEKEQNLDPPSGDE